MTISHSGLLFWATLYMFRFTDAQQFRWPKFQCCQPAYVEQLAAPTTRHAFRAFPAYTENISVWELVNHAHRDCCYCAL